MQQLIGRVPVHYAPARDADYQGVSVSNRAAKELLDWVPVTPFVTGVRRYLDWLGQAGATGAEPGPEPAGDAP